MEGTLTLGPWPILFLLWSKNLDSVSGAGLISHRTIRFPLQLVISKRLPRRLYFIACAEEVNCPGSVGVKGTLLGDELGETSLTSAACGAAAAAERNIVPQTIGVLKL